MYFYGHGKRHSEIDDTGDSQEKNFRKPCSLIELAISKFRHSIILKLVFGLLIYEIDRTAINTICLSSLSIEKVFPTQETTKELYPVSLYPDLKVIYYSINTVLQFS